MYFIRAKKQSLYCSVKVVQTSSVLKKEEKSLAKHTISVKTKCYYTARFLQQLIETLHVLLLTLAIYCGSDCFVPNVVLCLIDVSSHDRVSPGTALEINLMKCDPNLRESPWDSPGYYHSSW